MERGDMQYKIKRLIQGARAEGRVTIPGSHRVKHGAIYPKWRNRVLLCTLYKVIRLKKYSGTFAKSPQKGYQGYLGEIYQETF